VSCFGPLPYFSYSAVNRPSRDFSRRLGVVTRFFAREIESYAGTTLQVPIQFWSAAFGQTDTRMIHQAIPALFFGHAMMTWSYV
jgi:hypothetical protein